MKDKENLDDILYEELYKDYLKLLPEKINYLNSLINDFSIIQSEERLMTIVRSVHSIKGSAGSYGHDFLSKICRGWEDKLMSFKDFEKYKDDILKISFSGLKIFREYLENQKIEETIDHSDFF